MNYDKLIMCGLSYHLWLVNTAAMLVSHLLGSGHISAPFPHLVISFPFLYKPFTRSPAIYSIVRPIAKIHTKQKDIGSPIGDTKRHPGVAKANHNLCSSEWLNQQDELRVVVRSKQSGAP